MFDRGARRLGVVFIFFLLVVVAIAVVGALHARDMIAAGYVQVCSGGHYVFIHSGKTTSMTWVQDCQWVLPTATPGR